MFFWVKELFHFKKDILISLLCVLWEKKKFAFSLDQQIRFVFSGSLAVVSTISVKFVVSPVTNKLTKNKLLVFTKKKKKEKIKANVAFEPDLNFTLLIPPNLNITYISPFSVLIFTFCLQGTAMRGSMSQIQCQLWYLCCCVSLFYSTPITDVSNKSHHSFLLSLSASSK